LLFVFWGQVSVARPVVVLDPGHGGAARGCEGYYGVYEKVVTLNIAKKVRQELLNMGIAAVMTRQGDWDLPLKARAEVANAVQADCFVSIHCNAALTVDPHGVETYTYGNGTNRYEADEMIPVQEFSMAPGLGTERALQAFGTALESHVLALSIQKRLTGGLKGVKDRGVRQARYAVLHYNERPAVVAEVGFLTNDHEGKLLLDPDYQARIAHLVALGIRDFLGIRSQGAYRYLILRRLRLNRPGAVPGRRTLPRSRKPAPAPVGGTGPARSPTTGTGRP
jgi:N-acetylmuramoyl-L-alanine amidase